MPYNNTPIAPTAEVTGTCSLPLARIKKIILADPDTGSCSNNAAFAIAVATEQFIQYLVEQTHTVVKTERKPRRNFNIKYSDIASAVGKRDNLEFLSDIVPQTIYFKDYQKSRKDKAEPSAESEHMTNGGQQRLSFMTGQPVEHNDQMADFDDPEPSTANHDSEVQATSGSTTRLAYDAVRNSFEEVPTDNTPMEED